MRKPFREFLSDISVFNSQTILLVSIILNLLVNKNKLFLPTKRFVAHKILFK